MHASPSSVSVVRRSVRIEGVVQGVGFRPAMARLARALELTGCIKNDGRSVVLEVEGSQHAVARFLFEIPRRAPAAARVDVVEHVAVAVRGDSTFTIVQSSSGVETHLSSCAIPADLAPCSACAAELADPRDRHHRHPFIACTSCGPRYSVVRALPYDRAATAMAPFSMCDACAREYDNAGDRRYHAEAIACPQCGPRVSFVAGGGPVLEAGDALDAAVRLLAAGGIVAVKGVGGFVLACDATDDEAVTRLRSRKRTPDKPFAVMVRDVIEVERIARPTDAERSALLSPARPIVLVAAAAGGPLSPAVAPGLDEVGVFLPPSPLQELLAREGPPLLVMTSGNAAQEPIAADSDDAQRRLQGIADAFLLHDRDIVRRVDDSVVRVFDGRPVPLRRARGFVPELVTLPVAGPPLLAVGGDQDNTVCLARDGRALLSQHIGDLSDLPTFSHFLDVVPDLERLLSVVPAAVAHDLHADYRSTRFAIALGLPRVPVQHHHAHVAACLAEHHHKGPVIGVIFDGSGAGDDGTLWGGEIFEADLTSYRRLGHLRPLALCGGDAAVRQPWRIGLAALHDAEVPASGLFAGVDADRLTRVEELLQRGLPLPATSGAGRWFDAVSSLCGLCVTSTWEAQAAVLLEQAAGDTAAPAYAFALGDAATAAPASPFVVDLRPVVRAVARDVRAGVDAGVVAARFHETLAAVVLAGCRRARARGAPGTVVLSGGCFQNRRLSERARALLEDDGFEVLAHRRVPPNDGGLSLGQAAVASALLAKAR